MHVKNKEQIRYRMIKFNIPLRKKYSEKNVSKEVLEDLYINKKMSQLNISKILNINQQKIRNLMKQYMIPIRSFSDGLLIHHYGTVEQSSITNNEKEIIMGELLGDGNLTKPYNNLNCNTFYRHGNKHKEYIEWLILILPNLRWTEIITKKHLTKNNKEYFSYHTNSKIHKELNDIYYKFYSFDDKKQKNVKKIPEDIEITPLILRHWYLGDGCLSWGKLKSKGIWKIKKRRFPSITISCQGHSNSTLLKYIEQLKTKNITFTLVNNGAIMRLKSNSFESFFKYIGECPINCYNYKWNYLNDPYKM